jgi:hypothetical protein
MEEVRRLTRSSTCAAAGEVIDVKKDQAHHRTAREDGDNQAAATPDEWQGGVPLYRLARFLYESNSGKWFDDPKTISQTDRSKWFSVARDLLTPGCPYPVVPNSTGAVRALADRLDGADYKWSSYTPAAVAQMIRRTLDGAEFAEEGPFT